MILSIGSNEICLPDLECKDYQLKIVCGFSCEVIESELVVSNCDCSLFSYELECCEIGFSEYQICFEGEVIQEGVVFING